MCTRLLAVLAVALSFDACLLHINAVPNGIIETRRAVANEFMTSLSPIQRGMLLRIVKMNGERYHSGDEDEALKVFLSTLNHEEKQLLEKASRKNGQRSLGKDFGTEFKDFLAALVPPKGQLNLAMDYDIKATKGLPPKKDK
uniref:Uncharacterized protein n=1 Tax=Lygus hesperus TaxID=30085 RepID=A0A0K8SSQ3_LYGHE